MLVKLGNLSAVAEGTLKQFAIKDQEFLVIKLNGQLFCLDARCTHAGAPLAEGTLEGEVLTCPWHGSQFRVTDGAVLRGPTEHALKTYQVTVKDQSFFIET